MIFTAGNILLIGSILLFVSIIVGKTGYRFGVPALLLFLVVGMLFGSDGLGLQFHNANTKRSSRRKHRQKPRLRHRSSRYRPLSMKQRFKRRQDRHRRSRRTSSNSYSNQHHRSDASLFSHSLFTSPYTLSIRLSRIVRPSLSLRRRLSRNRNPHRNHRLLRKHPHRMMYRISPQP